MLEEGLLRSDLSLAQVRLLHEVARRNAATAAAIARELRLDSGYLSRLVGGLAERGLIERSRSPDDGRIGVLRLTDAGAATFSALDAAARDEIGAMLMQLPEAGRVSLVDAMGRVQRLLGAPVRSPTFSSYASIDPAISADRPSARRPLCAGIRLGRALRGAGRRHCRRFRRLPRPGTRALLGGRAGRCDRRLGHAGRRRERDRAPALLLVEPEARGLGLGRRLAAECVSFATAVGYRRITLWTQSILVAARTTYEAAGFRLVTTERHRSFGIDLIGEIWELDLRA